MFPSDLSRVRDDGFVKPLEMFNQRHPATFFCKITVRRSKCYLEISKGQKS